MTIQQGVAALTAYYGAWTMSAVQEAVVVELEQYDDAEIGDIVTEVLRGHAVRFGPPDVQAVSKAVAVLRGRRTLKTRAGDRENEIPCPVCYKTHGGVIRGTAALCGVCKYEIGTNPSEHGLWWRQYLAGTAPKFDTASIFRGLCQAKVEESYERR